MSSRVRTREGDATRPSRTRRRLGTVPEDAEYPSAETRTSAATTRTSAATAGTRPRRRREAWPEPPATLPPEFFHLSHEWFRVEDAAWEVGYVCRATYETFCAHFRAVRKLLSGAKLLDHMVFLLGVLLTEKPRKDDPKRFGFIVRWMKETGVRLEEDHRLWLYRAFLRMHDIHEWYRVRVIEQKLLPLFPWTGTEKWPLQWLWEHAQQRYGKEKTLSDGTVVVFRKGLL